jgi:hypothetical protein
MADIYGKIEREEYALSVCEEFPTKTKVGVEIELENMRGFHPRNPIFNKYWVISDDGSLRDNGMEIKTSKGFYGKDLQVAFDVFEEAIKEWDGEPSLSERTSVHVHLSMNYMTLKEFISFLTLYICVEKILFKVSGERDNNIYCLPIGTTHREDFLPLFETRILRNFAVKAYLNTPKYSAFNSSSLEKFGTVELRHHEGTADATRIKNWVKTLIQLKESSKVMDTTNLPSDISSIGFERWVKDCFGEMADYVSYPGYIEDLLQGARIAQDFLFSATIVNRSSAYFNHNRYLNTPDELKLIKIYAKKNGLDYSPIDELIEETNGEEEEYMGEEEDEEMPEHELEEGL